MKRVKVSTVAPPVSATSVMTAERLYTVTLGNHRVVRFTSERHALAFQADATRYLTDTMMSANLLLADAFVAYRYAWPYLDRTATGPKADASCAELVSMAERALDLASNDSASPNAVYFKWKHLGEALGAIRGMALRLEVMYLAKSQGVQRHAMQVLARRATELADALKHYGSDVDTATAL